MKQQSERRCARRRVVWRSILSAAAVCLALSPAAQADVTVAGAQKSFTFPISFFADVDFTMFGFDDGGSADDGDATLLVEPDPGPLPFTFTSLDPVGLGYDVEDDAHVAAGHATVQGAGAAWEAPIIALGPGGVGTLSVLDGGRVDAFVHVGGYYAPASGFGGLDVDLGPGEGALILSGPGSLLTGSLKLFDVFGTIPQIPAGASFRIGDGASADLSLLELTGYAADPVEYQGLITDNATQVHADEIRQRGLLRIEQGAALTTNALTSQSTSYEGARINTTITGSGSLLHVLGIGPQDPVLLLEDTENPDPEMLSVLAGGTLRTEGRSEIGSSARPVQTRVAGEGSLWDATAHRIDVQWDARLVAEEGGEVRADALQIAGVLRIEAAAVTSVDVTIAPAGRLEVAVGGLLSASNTTLFGGAAGDPGGAALVGAGEIVGAVRLAPRPANTSFAPVVAPGPSTAELTITGPLVLDCARLEIEIANFDPSGFDRIAVGGSVDAPPNDPGSFEPETTVAFAALPGYAPQQGDAFPFLTAAAGFSDVSGLTFDFSALPPGWAYDVETGTNALTLRVLPEPSHALLATAWLPFALARWRRSRAPRTRPSAPITRTADRATPRAAPFL